MSTTTISHPSSISLFTQLVRRLHLANARYDLIAYQCRCMQRPTHHARRRAYRVGLHIDISKARAAWFEDPVLVSVSVSAASTHVPSVSDRTAGRPVATETETKREEAGLDGSVEDALPNPWPERQMVARKRPATRLSPLGLELSNIDDVFRGPMPGAPRWRPKPLPEDGCDDGVAIKTNEPALSSTSKATCTYERVWRGVISTRVSDTGSLPVDLVCGSLGIMVPSHHLKRKLRDVDMDESAVVYRRPGVGLPDYGFVEARWGWSDL